MTHVDPSDAGELFPEFEQNVELAPVTFHCQPFDEIDAIRIAHVVGAQTGDPLNRLVDRIRSSR